MSERNRLAVLERERDELVKALRPFARAAATIREDCDGENEIHGDLEVRHLREAAQVLARYDNRGTDNGS